ncbi:beta-ketoacyl synthase, N-terminal domain protein [Mycobacterium kansasii]|uniref:Beta-ketoacyl synthase, N-terminal domain protein n=1 Tax=Mycobacterium kansasii TaxID=1768 RepID=A0A1V3WCN9_MYCKA|nr:beta-ketoacyl synthase, N-terminal domain protein [Mycobacterium kansasii]
MNAARRRCFGEEYRMQGPGFASPGDSLGEPIDVHELLAKTRETLARQRETIEGLRAGRREPVAVLGMGLRLPAGIETASQLWSFLRAGGDAITPIDDDGWNVTLDRDGAGRRHDAPRRVPRSLPITMHSTRRTFPSRRRKPRGWTRSNG